MTPALSFKATTFWVDLMVLHLLDNMPIYCCVELSCKRLRILRLYFPVRTDGHQVWFTRNVFRGS